MQPRLPHDPHSDPRPRIFVALVVACLAAGVGMVVTGVW